MNDSLPMVQLPVSPPLESGRVKSLSWSRFALCLIVTLALLLALVALPHPW